MLDFEKKNFDKEIHVKVSEDIYSKVKFLAYNDGTKMAQVIRVIISEYLKEDDIEIKY